MAGRSLCSAELELLSHYVNIGISLMMGATPVTYYLVETLRASPATVNTYSALTYSALVPQVLLWLADGLSTFVGYIDDRTIS